MEALHIDRERVERRVQELLRASKLVRESTVRTIEVSAEQTEPDQTAPLGSLLGRGRFLADIAPGQNSTSSNDSPELDIQAYAASADAA